MGGQPPRSLTLDAGALIAIEQDRRDVLIAVYNALRKGAAVLVPAGVLAQVWRGGNRQARLSQMMGQRGVSVVPLDELQARVVGVLCAQRGHDDIVDGSVVVTARQYKSLVLTSDPDHLRKLDPQLSVERL
ncbi:MAG: PIN domain-containing protein [Chloroflexota bacterium]|nr:MAG: PIN domain-containing protein [Chloroflexota bacterium]